MPPSGLSKMLKLLACFRIVLLAVLLAATATGHGYAMEGASHIDLASAQAHDAHHPSSGDAQPHAAGKLCLCCVIGFCSLGLLPAAVPSFLPTGRQPFEHGPEMAVAEALPPHPFRPPAAIEGMTVRNVVNL